MFRGIRFEQRLGFQMGRHTEHLLKSAVRMGFLEKISGPRVFNELMLILKEADPLPAMARLDELGLLSVIAAQLSFKNMVRRLFIEAKRIVDWYELLYTGERFQRWQVFFLCLLGEQTAEQAGQVRHRLGMPPRYGEVFGSEREAVHRLLRTLECRTGQRTALRPSEIHDLFKDLSIEVLLYAMARTASEEIRRIISHFITHLRRVSCLLGGDDLGQLGLVPGPVYKEVFRTLLAARLDGKVVSREDEIALVRTRFPGPCTTFAPGEG